MQNQTDKYTIRANIGRFFWLTVFAHNYFDKERRRYFACDWIQGTVIPRSANCGVAGSNETVKGILKGLDSETIGDYEPLIGCKRKKYKSFYGDESVAVFS